MPYLLLLQAKHTLLLKQQQHNYSIPPQPRVINFLAASQLIPFAKQPSVFLRCVRFYRPLPDLVPSSTYYFLYHLFSGHSAVVELMIVATVPCIICIMSVCLRKFCYNFFIFFSFCCIFFAFPASFYAHIPPGST